MDSLVLLFEKAWQIVVGVLLIIIIACLYIYDKLWQAWVFPQALYFFGLIGVAIFVLGSLLRFIIRNVQFLDDAFLAVWEKLPKRGGNGEEVPSRTDVIVRNSEWLQIISDTYQPTRRKAALPLGFTDTGKLVEFPASGNESHMMLTGGTGLGKGVFMNQFVIAAASTGLYQVVIISRSGKDYVRIKDMKNVHLITFDRPGLDSVEQARAFVDEVPFILRSASTEVHRRDNLCAKHKVTKISDLRVENRPPKVLFIWEEFTETAGLIRVYGTNRAVGDFFTYVGNIAKVGRAAGFHLIVINQSPVGEIPGFVRKELRKATFAVENASESVWTTGMKGAGAEHLYRYTDAAPDVPGELVYIGGNRVEVVRPAFTDQQTLDTAMRLHEHAVKDVGEPTWLYGYKSETQAGVVQEAPTAVMPYNKLQIDEPPTTPMRQGTAVNGARDSVAVAAVAERREAKRLTPKQVFDAAGWLFENHPGFEEYRGKDAFTKLHAQGVFVFLHSRCGISQTGLMQLVFNGKNGRYSDFVKHCHKYLVALERKAQGLEKR